MGEEAAQPWPDGWMDGWLDGWMDGWMDDDASDGLTGGSGLMPVQTIIRASGLGAALSCEPNHYSLRVANWGVCKLLGNYGWLGLGCYIFVVALILCVL